MRHAIPDSQGRFVYYTDCQWVQSSFYEGKEWCTRASCIGAGLWRQLFNVAEDVLGDVARLTVTKVKAHRSMSAVLDCPEETFRWAGNSMADVLAKRGARQHRIDTDRIEASTTAAIVVREVAVAIAKVATRRLEVFGKYVPADAHAPPVERVPWPPDTALHVPLLVSQLRWRCCRCLASAGILATLRRLRCHPIG